MALSLGIPTHLHDDSLRNGAMASGVTEMADRT